MVSGVDLHVRAARALVGERQRAEVAVVRLDALKILKIKFKINKTVPRPAQNKSFK